MIRPFRRVLFHQVLLRLAAADKFDPQRAAIGPLFALGRYCRCFPGTIDPHSMRPVKVSGQYFIETHMWGLGHIILLLKSIIKSEPSPRGSIMTEYDGYLQKTVIFLTHNAGRQETKTSTILTHIGKDLVFT
jgi:hypothetical protein